MNRLLLFEDKLGVSDGYQGIWNTLLVSTGFINVDVLRRNSYRSFPRLTLLIRQGNRKSPGFNTDESVQATLRQWVRSEIEQLNPDVIIVWDPAIYFLMNPEWNQATPDNMRGGSYTLFGIPTVCTLPISAWHNKKSEKDIAKLNDGFTDREEWELEQDSDDDESDLTDTTAVWLEPVSVPYGKFVLRRDMEKAKRLMDKRTQRRARIDNDK